MFAYLLVTSIALSIDALGIGISYRLKGVVIPLRTKIVIGVLTSVFMIGALLIGTLFHNSLPGQFAKYIGSGILLLTGFIFLKNSMSKKEQKTLDLDHSRAIEPLEGVLLTLALSTDSIGVGIALASTGINSYFLGILVGFMQVCFLFLADFLVRYVTAIGRFDAKIGEGISGGLLLLIGLLRFFG